jgi:phosphate-selective porin OprO and OprP
MTRLLLSGLCFFAAIGIASAQERAVVHVYGEPPAGFQNFNPVDNGQQNPFQTDSLTFQAGQPIPAVNPNQQPNPSQPDGTTEQRIKQLETQVNQLQNLLQNQPGSASGTQGNESSDQSGSSSGTSSGSSSGTSSDQNSGTYSGVPGGEQMDPDALYVRSKNGKNLLRLTGQIQGDNHSFLNSTDTTDLDTFEVRRARFGLEGTLFQYYEFRLLSDFGQGKVVIQDAFLNIRYWAELQLEVGKFKQPISYEEVDIQDRFVPFLERSMIDQLTPARDPGVMAHGDLFDGRISYYASLSNGGINGDLDTNDSSDFDSRIVVKPFDCPYYSSYLRGFQFGFSGGYGIEHEPINPNTLKTPLGVPWFEYNSTVTASGVRTRFCPEMAYFYGPMGFAAQYMDWHQDMRPTATTAIPKTLVDLPIEGFYVMATVLLTGEDRQSYSELSPLAPFDIKSPFSAPGAWELAERISRVEVSEQAFYPGTDNLANPKLYSRGATEVTSGVNWYLNKFVRIQFNWEHSWFDEPVQLGTGPGGRTQHQDALGTRFQLVF